ncbi:MAG: hypothetical protein ABIT70_15500, partial [Sulfuriferula sp.]
SPGYTFLDTNGDGTYNSSDNVTLTNGSSAVVTGVKISGSFGSTPVSLSNGGSFTTVSGLSSGGTTGGGGGGGPVIPNALNIQGSPRASWSQIK